MFDNLDEILYVVGEQANSAVDYDAMYNSVLKENVRRLRKGRRRIRVLGMAAGFVLLLGVGVAALQTEINGINAASRAKRSESGSLAGGILNESTVFDAVADDGTLLVRATEALSDLDFGAVEAGGEALISMNGGGSIYYDVTGGAGEYIGEIMLEKLCAWFENVVLADPQQVVGQLEVGYAVFLSEGGVLWKVDSEWYALVEDAEWNSENWLDILREVVGE